VSSTFSDLKEEREKVLQAILQLRAFPAGMELFPAADEDQFDFIKREIDSSDYYILILAGRYGTVDAAGVSFTEREYDYARSIGKPVLAFIVKDLGKLIGDKLEKTEDLRSKLEAFIEKTKTGKLVNFFANPDELKSSVLISLPSQFNIKPMNGWVRAGQSSRLDLERITSLQQRVLELEAEYSKLVSQQDSTALQLEGGAEIATWSFPVPKGLQPELSQGLKLEISRSWDELLLLAFPGGSSYEVVAEIRDRLRKVVLEAGKVCQPLEEGDPASWDRWLRVLEEIVFRSLHTQFTGLSLIEERKETIYSEGFGSEQIVRTVSNWRLTVLGEKHLALVRGKRRPSAQNVSDLED